jgi:glycosyltransferase involved in cell wall biosynthesis
MTGSKLAVGICTYNRAPGLRAVLGALDLQRLNGLDDDRIEIVVADNSADGSAGPIVAEYGRQGRFRVRYLSERRKGLSFVRNAVLAEALEMGATWLAYIDDDEMPGAGWLEALLQGLRASSCAAAIGPVYPVFEVAPPAWLPTSAFVIRRAAEAGFAGDGYTCNCILSVAAIEAAGLRFDERFNETGGEDTYFFKELRERGGRIAWCEAAVVYETVPRHRMRSMWLWRRWFRTGGIEAYLQDGDARSIAGKATALARGGARIFAGAAKIGAGAVRAVLGERAAFVASFYTFCRGAGLIANAIGREHKEYAVRWYR